MGVANRTPEARQARVASNIGVMQERAVSPSEERIRHSALGPLREPLFRRLWIAAVVSYIGTWMQNLGAGWLMASLTSSPLMVGLVQAAMALPVFLVVLPAGALADVVDRRKLLLVTQSWMVAAAATLGALTLSGHITPWLLLLFTFVLGLGAVMNDPAWQAITPEVVSHENFASAVALNSAGFNVARAIGPAIGGVIIASAGSGTAFLLNAASFFGVILFLHRWQRSSATVASSERVLPALASGFRHFRDSAAVKACLVRTLMFSFAASAVLAMLPLIARPCGSVGFGIMLGFFGLGALVGTAVLSRLRHHLPMDAIIALATVLFAAASISLGMVHECSAQYVILLAAGVGWIQIVASLNISAQTMSPVPLRARAISMYLLVLQGGMAAGSATWGAVASRYGIERALVFAGCALLLGLAAIPNFRLAAGELPLGTAVQE